MGGYSLLSYEAIVFSTMAELITGQTLTGYDSSVLTDSGLEKAAGVFSARVGLARILAESG